MVPSSVSKRNLPGPEAPFLVTTKSEVPLNTTPVGADVPVLPGGGTVTTSGVEGLGNGLPLPEETVATPVPLSATQKGPVGLKATLQEFTKLARIEAGNT